MTTFSETTEKDRKDTYWHREMPPSGATEMGEHTFEADSGRLTGTVGCRDELWDHCADLMVHARARLNQEVARLGGDYAVVLGEWIDSRRDEATGEAWLHGHFAFMLYERQNRARRFR